MKFYCIRDRKKHKYEDTATICAGCTLERCRRFNYYAKIGISASAVFLGSFMRLFEP